MTKPPPDQNPKSLPSLIKKLSKRGDKLGKQQPFDLHRFKECVKSGETYKINAEQIYKECEASIQAKCEMMRAYLRCGMYLKAQCIHPSIDDTETLNLWIQYWVEFGSIVQG